MVGAGWQMFLFSFTLHFPPAGEDAGATLPVRAIQHPPNSAKGVVYLFGALADAFGGSTITEQSG